MIDDGWVKFNMEQFSCVGEDVRRGRREILILIFFFTQDSTWKMHCHQERAEVWKLKVSHYYSNNSYH